MQYTYYQPSRQSSVPSGLPPRQTARRRLARGGVLLMIAWVGISLLNSQFTHAHTNIQSGSQSSQAKVYSKAQTVCIDPGHGGTDPGATTTDGLITERDINLTVAKRVASDLNKAGYQVFMTRTTNDATLTNHDRYTYCNNQHATIMVSIHHNYFDDTTVDYATALFYKDQDQGLATSILNSVATKLSLQNDGISQFDDGVLSESTMPAALSEGFFITSDSEYDQLTASGSTRLDNEGDAIAAGITSYFTEPAAERAVINSNPQVIERDDASN